MTFNSKVIKGNTMDFYFYFFVIKWFISDHQIGFLFSLVQLAKKKKKDIKLIKIYYNEKYTTRAEIWFGVPQQDTYPNKNLRELQSIDSVFSWVPSAFLLPFYAQACMPVWFSLSVLPTSLHFLPLLRFSLWRSLLKGFCPRLGPTLLTPSPLSHWSPVIR